METEENNNVPQTSNEEKKKNRMFDHPFSFKGRIGFPEYFITFLIVCAILCLRFFIDPLSDEIYLYYILCFAAIYFLIAQGTKRCHDFGNNGWGQILPTFQIVMLFFEGESSKNQYGEALAGNQDDQTVNVGPPELKVEAVPNSGITVTKEESPQNIANKITTLSVLFGIGGLIELWEAVLTCFFPDPAYVPSNLWDMFNVSPWIVGLHHAQYITFALLGIYAFFTVYLLWTRKNKAIFHARAYTILSFILCFASPAIFLYGIILATILWLFKDLKKQLIADEHKNSAIDWCIPTSIAAVTIVIFVGIGNGIIPPPNWHHYAQSTQMPYYNGDEQATPTPIEMATQPDITFTEEDCGPDEFTDGSVIYTKPKGDWSVRDTVADGINIFAIENDSSQIKLFSLYSTEIPTKEDFNQLWTTMDDPSITNPKEFSVKDEVIDNGDIHGFRRTATVESDLPMLCYKEMIVIENQKVGKEIVLFMYSTLPISQSPLPKFYKSIRFE